VRVAREQAGVSERRACGLVQIQRASARYRWRRPRDLRFEQRLRELAAQRVRFGYRRLHVLLQREGWAVNHKRVYRVYREAGLAVRRRKRKRAAASARVPLAAPVRPNQGWSMDFMADALGTGRRFRTLNLVDEYTREALALEVDTSLPGERVVRVLERLRSAEGRKPEWIVTDNGPEFTGRALDQWAYENGVRLETIRPGRPMENGYIESFNGKMREECLNQSWFTDLADARQRIEAWRVDYNTRRPHSALGYLTPAEFAQRAAALRSPTAPCAPRLGPLSALVVPESPQGVTL
jgi:putative transposase